MTVYRFFKYNHLPSYKSTNCLDIRNSDFSAHCNYFSNDYYSFDAIKKEYCRWYTPWFNEMSELKTCLKVEWHHWFICIWNDWYFKKIIFLFQKKSEIVIYTPSFKSGLIVNEYTWNVVYGERLHFTFTVRWVGREYLLSYTNISFFPN